MQGAIRGDAWYISSRYCSGAWPTLLLAADSMVIEESSLRGAAGRDLALLACHHDLVQLQVQLFSARSDSALGLQRRSTAAEKLCGDASGRLKAFAPLVSD